MKNVFSQGKKPLKLRSDKGSEYTANAVKKFLKSENIEPDSTPSNPSVGTPVSDNKRKKNISFPLESDEDDE